MRGKKAKQIRKNIYGDHLSPLFREYRRDPKTGKLVSDKRRWAYQHLKKDIKQGG